MYRSTLARARHCLRINTLSKPQKIQNIAIANNVILHASICNASSVSSVYPKRYCFDKTEQLSFVILLYLYLLAVLQLTTKTLIH